MELKILPYIYIHIIKTNHEPKTINPTDSPGYKLVEEMAGVRNTTLLLPPKKLRKGKERKKSSNRRK